MKGVSPDELNVTFDVLHRIERSANDAVDAAGETEARS
jgi:hypothetical protein